LRRVLAAVAFLACVLLSGLRQSGWPQRAGVQPGRAETGGRQALLREAQRPPSRGLVNRTLDEQFDQMPEAAGDARGAAGAAQRPTVSPKSRFPLLPYGKTVDTVIVVRMSNR
jgi:hypothetical protein